MTTAQLEKTINRLQSEYTIEFGWHFALRKRLALYDNNPTPIIRAGRLQSVDGRIDCCLNGLHASDRLRDAYFYCNGQYLSYVANFGELRYSGDKYCSRYRFPLAVVNLDTMPEIKHRKYKYSSDWIYNRQIFYSFELRTYMLPQIKEHLPKLERHLKRIYA